jgi:hypothetical protein
MDCSPKPPLLACLLSATWLSAGCSLKTMAVKTVANTLAAGGRGGIFARSHRGGTALLNIAFRQRSSACDCVTVTRGFSLVHTQSHSRYHPVSRVVAPRRHPAHLAVLAARRRVHTNSRASPVAGVRAAQADHRQPQNGERQFLDAAIVQHCHQRTRSPSRRSLSLAQQFWYAPIPFCFNRPH